MEKRYILSMAHKEMRGLEYLVYSAVSLCLLLIMVFIPLAPAFADEVTVAGGDTEALEPQEIIEVKVQDEDIVATTAETITETVDFTGEIAPVVQIEANVQEESNSENIDNVLSNINTDDTDIVDGTEYSNEVLPADPELLDETVLEVEDDVPLIDGEPEVNIPEQEVVDESTEESVDEENVPSESELEAQNTEEQSEDTDDVEVEEVEDEAVLGEVITVNAVSDDTNKFSFSKDECTTVGDGTFYCAQAVADAEVTYTDRIFSAKDVDGDKEIYVEKNGELIQISSNQFDDDAPYYDEVSNTAVWHRLIEGRYQIIVYDFDTEEEVQLTNDRYNNMQPNRFGDAIVWQGWVGSDWEVFIETKGTVKMLTDNTTHDITPSVNGTHIVWQSFENNAWQMKVYDMRTGAIDTIENADGGSIENPRFVLVYDTKFESGDIETKGYDLKSGEVVHLSAKPVSLPEELPDPDQTGEERALVSTVTQLKPKTESDDDTTPDTAGGSDGDPENGDIIIDAFAPDVQSTSTVEVVLDSVDVDIPTIEIPALEEVATSSVDHITDVIVTPYVEEIATSTDTH
jgi:hypothetical protein